MRFDEFIIEYKDSNHKLYANQYVLYYKNSIVWFTDNKRKIINTMYNFMDNPY